MKWLSRVIYSICALFLLGGLALFALPYFGHFEVKIVKSGSMEPTIHTGSIVVIQGKGAYAQNDVITFTSAGADIPTTHRIIGTEVVRGETRFITKGDANEERDAELVVPNVVIGKVILTLPYLGYLLDFARQPIGFGLLVGIPAFLIIFDEVEKIWREIRKRKKKDDLDSEGGMSGKGGGGPKESVSPLSLAPLVLLPFEAARVAKRHVDVRRRVPQVLQISLFHQKRERSGFGTFAPLAVACLIALCVMRLGAVGTTLSYMSDFEFSEMNTLVAQALGFTASPDETSFTFLDGVLEGSDGEIVTLFAPEEGSVPMKYAVSVASTSGNPALCDALVVQATDPFAYNGPLLGLAASDITFGDSWALLVGLQNGAYVPGDSCVVDLTYRAWNAESEALLDGYDDEEKIQLTFNVGQPLEGFAPFGAELVGNDIIIDVESETGSTTNETEDGPGKSDEPHENNGHGNDEDGNDDSNPGNSNDPEDTTDDEAVTENEGEGTSEETAPPATEEAEKKEKEEKPEKEVEELLDDTESTPTDATEEVEEPPLPPGV